MMTNDDEATLEYDHNVIEHLGIRLYQNKFSNVISELVSNSWDAGAENVYIEVKQNTDPSCIVVRDDGVGMSFDDLKNHYLVIGKPKRRTPKERVYRDRKPMGRKGIGKLAPFGIARTVDIITVNSGELNWFTLELAKILALGPAESKYKPPFHIQRSNDVSEWVVDPNHPLFDIITNAIDSIRSSGSGTAVVLSGLTLNQLALDSDVRHAMADKYNIVLARDDFALHVNGVKIANDEALPTFEFRIPSNSGFLEENIDGRPVRYWAGFVGSAKWSSEQAGAGVYSHGKIAQDRPFYFGSRGKEIFQRYLYAVVEADWIDELDVDVISTDRTGVDWSNEALVELKKWGSKKVLSWLDEYARFRAGRHNAEVKEYNDERRRLNLVPRFTEVENDEIDKLVANATRDADKNDETLKEELLSAVSKAWINLPSRNLIKSLWRSLADADEESSFSIVVSKLQEQSVPEAMGLALTFAQRAYALSMLTQLIHRKSETKLQHLVEEFPWIIQPRGDLLTANQHLRTTIHQAADALELDDGDRAGRIISGMTEKERADFVFLTDASQKQIAVVEIKSPNHELTQENRRQLADYLDFVEQFHSEADVEGILIGRVPKGFRANDQRIKAKSWNEILLECRSSYVTLLAAMLDRADPSPEDARVGYVHEFGGTAVWDLLNTLAKHDEALHHLMSKYNKLLLEGQVSVQPGQ